MNYLKAYIRRQELDQRKRVFNIFMDTELRRTYFLLLLPAVFGLLLTFLLQHLDVLGSGGFRPPVLVASLLFVLSGVFALALPIFYRALFANRMRSRQRTPEADWFRFERNLILIPLVTPYITLAAQVLRLPRFHLAGTILMTLYALYYYYPSRRRLDFERRIFRVR
jgi:MFS family permease